MSEFDSPWKEALDLYLVEFLHFFFPDIHADIDWSHNVEVLDKELEQIMRDAEIGKRLADKLFKVWRKNGGETWVLTHIEIQAQPDAEFAERMFVYHYRIFDRYRKHVVSLAVLGDERADWRPDSFSSALWGCETSLRFPIVKLLDYADQLDALEKHENPFGLIVLAHLQSQATRDEEEQRRIWKVKLVKSLLNRGMSAEDVRQFFRLIDWFLELPDELEQQFATEIDEYQKEKKMPYISKLERWAMEKGQQEGALRMIAASLEKKFASDGIKLMPGIRDITDTESLEEILECIWTANSLEKVRERIAEFTSESAE